MLTVEASLSRLRFVYDADYLCDQGVVTFLCQM